MEDDSTTAIIAGLVRELRPHQWYKQLVLFIPVIFAGEADNPESWALALAGAVLFSMAAGVVYLVNDIFDREEDRQHPIKRHRPIASGLIGVRLAAATAVCLLIGSLTLSYRLDPLFTVVVLLYLLQNTLYSVKLREFVFVDVSLIGIGFVLRAIAGVVLIDVPMSPWLVLCTYLAALMLATGKRLSEHQHGGESTRSSLSRYTTRSLRFMFTTSSALLLAAYSLYTFEARSDSMLATIPFAFYAVFGYNFGVERGKGERPATIIFEPGMVVNFLLWASVVLAILYVLPSYEVFP